MKHPYVRYMTHATCMQHVLLFGAGFAVHLHTSTLRSVRCRGISSWAGRFCHPQQVGRLNMLNGRKKWPRHWPYCWRWFEILLAFFFVFIESGPCVGSTAKLIENVSLTLRGRIICWPLLECRPNVYTWLIMSDLANRCYTYFTSSGVPKVRADNNQMEAWFGNFHVNIL